MVALVAARVGYGVEVEGLLAVGLHSEGQRLCHEDLAAQHGQQALLRIAESAGVCGEAEGYQAEVVPGGDLPAHLMAASRHYSLHRDFGGGEQQVERLHRGRIEDFQFRFRCDRLLARVDDICHHPDGVVVVHVARHVGHDHDRLGAGEGVFLVTGLTLLGVG